MEISTGEIERNGTVIIPFKPLDPDVPEGILWVLQIDLLCISINRTYAPFFKLNQFELSFCHKQPKIFLTNKDKGTNKISSHGWIRMADGKAKIYKNLVHLEFSPGVDKPEERQIMEYQLAQLAQLKQSVFSSAL